MVEQVQQYLQTNGTFSTIVTVVLGVLSIVAMWRIFEKAGIAGWKSLIPLYSTYILYQITWGKGWKFLLLLIPIVNIVIGIKTSCKLSKAFGKSTGFTWGLVLLNTLFILILGFDKSEYQGVPAK